MPRTVIQCTACSPQAWTKSDCRECKGFGEYWGERRLTQGFRPADADAAPNLKRNGEGDFTERQRQGAFSLYKAGWAVTEIAREMRISSNLVNVILDNCAKKEKTWTIEDLVAAHALGMSLRAIGLRYGIDASTVKFNLNKAGVDTGRGK
jgi:hypothetical protein